MKPHVKLSLFKTLLILLLHILPYAFLSSCGDTEGPDPEIQTITTDNSINSTLGMMKVLVTYNSGGTHFQYAMLTQASRTEIAVVDNTFSYFVKPMADISTINITKWLPGTFWGRSVTGTTVTDSLCCTSVRYEGSTGNWFLESPADTIIKHRNMFSIINCYEKCPYGN